MKMKSMILAVVATASFGTHASAGEPETLNDGTAWRWNPMPVSQPMQSIPWQIARTTGPQRWVVPGFRRLECTTGGAQRPGVYSIVRGARAWNEAQHPGVPASPGSNVSDFSFDDPHTSFYLADGNEFSLFAPDFQNVVSALGFLPEIMPMTDTWAFLGEPPAVTCVWLDPSGTIIDSDVAVNTGEVSGLGAVQQWGFIEENHLQGVSGETYVSTNQPPVGGYFDLRGLMTNSFGRMAGLASSLLTGEHDGASGHSTEPTMYPIAGRERIASTSAIFQGQFSTCVGTTSLTLTNYELFARRAQTLEFDDVIAIASNYPNAAFTTLGTISGTVRLDQVTVQQVGRVIVMEEDDPAGTRVGVTLRSDGTYTVPGLSPGRYYVYVDPAENVNTVFINPGLGSIPDPNGTMWAPFEYFFDGELPYRYQQFVGGVPWNPVDPRLSANAYRHFNAELFNSPGDSGTCECDQGASSFVDLTSGANAVADLLVLAGDVPGVQGSGDLCPGGMGNAFEAPHALWVGIRANAPGGGGALSSQGIRYQRFVIDGQLVLSFLTAGNLLRDCGGGTWAGGTATLRLSDRFDATRRADGSLELITNGVTTPITQTLDANSLTSFDFLPGQFPPAGISGNYVNVFAQVEIQEANPPTGSTPKLSNIVHVRVEIAP